MIGREAKEKNTEERRSPEEGEERSDQQRRAAELHSSFVREDHSAMLVSLLVNGVRVPPVRKAAGAGPVIGLGHFLDVVPRFPIRRNTAMAVHRSEERRVGKGCRS